MRNRISAFLICLCILLSTALPVRAVEQEASSRPIKYTITSLDSFLLFAEKCRLDSFSQNLQAVLMTDLDLTGTDFKGIPTFSGSFEGGGHTIKGLRITKEGSNQGLFRYLTDTAVVQNLKVIGTVQPTGSRSFVGGIAGNNAGMILNCSFSGSVSASEYAGGIAAVNSVSGIVENCTVSGSISGSHFIGGIVGENSGVIRGCTNEARVNDTSVQNTVELTDVSLNTITSAESVTAVTDIGGIAGGSKGVIRSCTNNGNVGYPHMGYNIGGIAGSQSGTLMDCENNGVIQGRKEVGGIVGQMEPTALIRYEEDALQILQRQLDAMGGTINATVSSVQGTGDRIVTKVEDLKDYVLDAKDAVESLLPDPEDPQPPDEDTVQAAQNAISSSLAGMTDTLQGMGETAYSSLGAVSTNLHTLQSQMNAMRNTLGNVSQTIGGSITDVSDLDTELDLTGKVDNCRNFGNVLADRNAGGIAGAIAMENDLDHEDDWTILGSNSLNFESELRAVIQNCENAAQVTCKKQNGGGIAGWQAMGLVRSCINTGNVVADGADYVGGISGQSYGFIRSCAAKCSISGSTYTGGIAGSATVVTDCRSLVEQTGGTEKAGEVLGELEQGLTEQENPVSGNLYFSVSKDLGGIDGISYSGQAEALTREAFLALEDIPEGFRNVRVAFRYPNGTERSFSVPLGEALSTQWVPAIPPKAGYDVRWSGLEEDTLKQVLFEMTFDVAYTEKRSVLQSEERTAGQPVLLVLGVFEDTAALTLTPSQAIVPVQSREVLLQTWDFSVTDAEAVTQIRLRMPEDLDEENAKLMILGEDGLWRETQAEGFGSYLAAAVQEGDRAVALIQPPSYRTEAIAAIGVFAVLLVTWLAKRRKKQKPETE